MSNSGNKLPLQLWWLKVIKKNLFLAPLHVQIGFESVFCALHRLSGAQFD